MTIDWAIRSNKHVAIVVHSTKLIDAEQGLDRMTYIANMLASSGYHVDIITSSFQHWQKEQRDTSSPAYLDNPYRIVFLQEPSYKRNIDPMRIRSHSIFNKNLKRFLSENSGRYDAMICQIPPNNIAATAAKLAESEDIPLIIDVNDLWPEAMRMVIDIPILSDIAFAPMARDAKTAYTRAWGIIGTSDEYAAYPSKYLGTTPENSTTVYVGSDLSRFDAALTGPESDADLRLDGIDDDAIVISYAGTLGKSYDIQTLIDAVELAAERMGGEDVVLAVLGDGPARPALEEQASACSHADIRFFGYVPYESMARILAGSDIVVNSLVKGAPQSIVSKISDYLASGRPMINTGESDEMRGMVDSLGFGINVAPEDAGQLADAICALATDADMRDQMGRNARDAAERLFDRPVSYAAVLAMVDEACGIAPMR